MSAKTLISSVSHQNEFSSNETAVFVHTLTPACITRIKQLAAAAKELKVAWVEDFNYDGSWSGKDWEEEDGACLEELVEAVSADHARLDELMPKITASPNRVESQMLRVSEGEFYYSAIPKHYDRVNKMTTMNFPLSVLDSEDSLIIKGFDS